MPSKTESSVAPAVSANDELGYQFISQYYQILHSSPERLHQFYKSDSVCSHASASGEIKVASGQKEINEHVGELYASRYSIRVNTFDTQPSTQGNVLVVVLGVISLEYERRFSQTFVLAKESDTKYYVRNDVFRYIDPVEAVEEEIEEAEVAAPAEEPAPVAAPEPVAAAPAPAAVQETAAPAAEPAAAAPVEEAAPAAAVEAAPARAAAPKAKQQPPQQQQQQQQAAPVQSRPPSSYAGAASRVTAAAKPAAAPAATEEQPAAKEEETAAAAAPAAAAPATTASAPAPRPVRTIKYENSLFIRYRVGGTDAELRALFSKAGTIKDLTLPKDKTFAYLEFTETAPVTAILANRQAYIVGNVSEITDRKKVTDLPRRDGPAGAGSPPNGSPRLANGNRPERTGPRGGNVDRRGPRPSNGPAPAK